MEEADLATLPAISPSELVSFLPGFSVAQPEWYAGRPVVSARGFFGGGEAEYVLLLVDGVPVADVESGLIDWSLIPSSSIRRIEAFRGPGASLYGDSAVGGVIQILTHRSANRGRLTATGGSFSTFSGDGAYGGSTAGLGFNISGAVRSTDGGFEHSSGRQLVGGGAIDGGFRALTWRWDAAVADRRRDDPGALPRDVLAVSPRGSDPLHRFDDLNRRNVSSAFTLRHAAAGWRPQLRIYTSARTEDLVRTILLAPGLGDRKSRGLSSVAVGGSFEVERTAGAARPVTLRMGADLAREQLETAYRDVSAAGAVSDTVQSDAAGHRLRAGIYASASWDALPRLRLSGGLRRDAVNDGGFEAGVASDRALQGAWSPRVGAVVQLTPSGSAVMFGQVSGAFKAPTLDQLFDPRPYPDFMGGTFTISNARLVPQRAVNLEAGVSGGGSVRFSALAYRMTVDDEIDFDLRTFSYANIGNSQHSGVELELEGRWWERVRPSVGYALSHVSAVDGGNQLKNVPRHVLTAAIHVELPWSLAAFARYRAARGAFLDDENLFPVDGPSTLDLRLRRSVGRQTLFVDAVNLTDDVYEVYGFTLADFRGGLVAYGYPGAPRALRAGVTFAF